MNPRRCYKPAVRFRFASSALFLGFIWLPILGWLWPANLLSRVDENRVPAPLPSWGPGPGAARRFISGFENYFNDHFGFRQPLILAGQLLNRVCLTTTDASGVIMGRQGWLYYTWVPGQAPRPAGAPAAFSTARLEAWRRLFESRRDWLARRHIPYLIVIPPDKELIYPEFLPAWAAGMGNQADLDCFMQYMKANTRLPILDLRPPLLEAKKTERPYLLTDIHWNQYGALFASRAIIGALARDLPGLKPLRLDGFDQQWETQPGGCLAKLLTSERILVEKDVPTLTPRPPLKTINVGPADPPASISFRAENPGQNGTLLIFGDSFTQALLPFLGQDFGRVLHFELYGSRDVRAGGKPVFAHTWRPSLVESAHPVAVVDEILQSFLCLEDPADLMREDGLGR